MPTFKRKPIEVEAVKLSVAVSINNGDGTSAHGTDGDYLVSYPDGKQRLVPEADFESDFEPTLPIGSYEPKEGGRKAVDVLDGDEQGSNG